MRQHFYRMSASGLSESIPVLICSALRMRSAANVRNDSFLLAQQPAFGDHEGHGSAAAVGIRTARRPKEEHSTDFSCAVFLVTRMFDNHGWALFMRCERILHDAFSERRASCGDLGVVLCVQHEHMPGETVHFLGEVQSADPKKNWGSLMLNYCGRQMAPPAVCWSHLVDGRPADVAAPGEGGTELLCPEALALLPLEL